MNLVLNEVILPTKEKYHLIRFLNEIFEQDMLQDEKGEYILINNLKFRFEVITSKRNRSNRPSFEFLVDSVDELHYLMQKIEFFYYRDQQKVFKHPKDALDLTSDENGCYLTIMDPDFNRWQFNFYSRAEQEIKRTYKTLGSFSRQADLF